jgi:hypothetical protein
MVENDGQAATVFAVVSGYFIQGARVENLTIDGNKDENLPLNGCRGGGIFLYRCPGTVIASCVVTNYNGDGISFQQSNDAQVLNCVSEANNGLGLHPGSGSQRPVVRGCTARNNGEDGLFLCWRVKQGVFEENISKATDVSGFPLATRTPTTSFETISCGPIMRMACSSEMRASAWPGTATDLKRTLSRTTG